MQPSANGKRGCSLRVSKKRKKYVMLNLVTAVRMERSKKKLEEVAVGAKENLATPSLLPREFVVRRKVTAAAMERLMLAPKTVVIVNEAVSSCSRNLPFSNATHRKGIAVVMVWSRKVPGAIAKNDVAFFLCRNSRQPRVVSGKRAIVVRKMGYVCPTEVRVAGRMVSFFHKKHWLIVPAKISWETVLSKGHYYQGKQKLSVNGCEASFVPISNRFV